MNNLFKQNVGSLDRVLRVSAGIILMFLSSLIVKGTTGTALTILSVPLLISGITSVCPAYALLGISTKRETSCC